MGRGDISHMYINILRHENFKHRSAKIAHGKTLKVRVISNLGNKTAWIGKLSSALSLFHEQSIVVMQWLQDSLGDVLHSLYEDKGMDKFCVL